MYFFLMQNKVITKEQYLIEMLLVHNQSLFHALLLKKQLLSVNSAQDGKTIFSNLKNLKIGLLLP